MKRAVEPKSEEVKLKNGERLSLHRLASAEWKIRGYEYGHYAVRGGSGVAQNFYFNSWLPKEWEMMSFATLEIAIQFVKREISCGNAPSNPETTRSELASRR
jgi:hypothetical protein